MTSDPIIFFNSIIINFIIINKIYLLHHIIIHDFNQQNHFGWGIYVLQLSNILRDLILCLNLT